MAEAKTWKNTFFAWISSKQMNELADDREIRAAHSTWIDALNGGELVRLLTWMADDAVFLNPGQAPFGRDGFSANFPAAHQRVRVHGGSELEGVVAVGGVACTRSRDALSATPRTGGEAAQFAGHRITVFVGDQLVS